MSGPYDNPDEYNKDADRRKEMLKRAIQFMEKKKADDEEIDMSSEDIVEAAEKFDEFINNER